MTSDRPHQVPFQIIDDFAEKIVDNKEINIKVSEPREIEKEKPERIQKGVLSTKNKNEVKVNNDNNLKDKQNAQALVKFHSPETDKENLEEKENKLIPT